MRDSNKPKSGILSTVIISLLVAFGIVMLFFLVPIDFNESGVSKPLEDSGEMIIIISGIFYGAATALFMLFIYGLTIAMIFTHFICLMFSISNRSSRIKTVRIISYILDILNIAIIIICIIRLILWWIL